MGLFDELKKIGKEVLDNIQNAQNGYTGSTSSSNYSNSSRNVQSVSSVPEEFSNFPQFNTMPSNSKLITTNSYHRCSMDFSNISADEISNYSSILISNGYAKNSNVRFDKGNTYIIVDYKSSGKLNLVFHVRV